MPDVAAALAKIKTSNTPHLDALTDKEQIFVLTLYVTGSNSQAARKSGYADTGASAIARRPTIQAALQEQREYVLVLSPPTNPAIVDRLWLEAHKSTNSGQARISALKALADIKGMTGGGGNDGDSALTQFYLEAGRAVTAGVFDGLKDAGRKAVEGADAGAREGAPGSEGVSQGDHGAVVVDAKVVEPAGDAAVVRAKQAGVTVNLAGAFEVPAKEVK